MVGKTSFAASIDESKGVLVGVLTEIEKDSVQMVALDGFRLAVAKRENGKRKKENRFIISAKIINEISKIISEDEDTEYIEISLGSKKAVFKIGNTEVILRLMEGEYIKYRDIIPDDGTTEVRIGKAILLESIERASLLRKKERTIS